MTDRSTPNPGADVGRNPEVDVVVIGAGPAGSIAAVTAARAGRQVMLLERAAFPREKVCGCCIAPRGVDELASAGLETVLDDASRLECVRLEGGQRSAVITRDSGIAISRGALDARLVEAARAAGVAVHHGASASVVRDGSVEVTIDGVTRPIRARACVVADGLAGRSLDAHPGVRWCVARDSRIGLGAILAAEVVLRGAVRARAGLGVVTAVAAVLVTPLNPIPGLACAVSMTALQVRHQTFWPSLLVRILCLLPILGSLGL